MSDENRSTSDGVPLPQKCRPNPDSRGWFLQTRFAFVTRSCSENCYISYGMWHYGWLVLSALLCSDLIGGAESFTIRSGVGPTGRTEVRYFLTGPFGGYGAFVRGAEADGTYRIPLTQNGKPANTLKAILYARGCQFSLISMDLATTPTRSAMFECLPLSTITLSGQVSPPPSGRKPGYFSPRSASRWPSE
jgi:hypothetical protein